MVSTWFVDLVNGSDSNTGLSFAQRLKTLSKAASLGGTGDTVRVMGNAATSSGTATWTNASSLVTLSASLTQLLYGDGAWTHISTNVTASAVASSPSPKQGSNSCKLVCNSSFTTGLMAYFGTGTLTLSSYQQVSFWIQSTTALASGALKINLCSDTAGATALNSITLNVALNANQWTCVTLNNGSAFSSTAVKSISLTALTSLASKTIFIDNVVACSAPSAAGCLTLNTLISPDNSTWYHVQSINGTSVYFDGQAATAATAAKGFQPATVTSGTFYMLQPTQVAIGASGTTYAQTFSLNGSSASQVTISGGWDSTAMTSQSGWTTIDMMDWTASAISLTGTTGYVTVDHFNFARCNFPLGLVSTAKGYVFSNGSNAGTGSFSNMPSHGMSISGRTFINTSGTTAMINIPQSANYNTDGVAWSVVNCNLYGCTVDGIDVPENVGSPGITITGCNASGTGGYGFNIQSSCGGGFFNNTANNNTNPGFNFANMYDFVGSNLTAQGNGTAQVQLNDATVEIYTLNTNTPAGSSLPQINIPSGSVGQAVIYSWTQYTGGSPAFKLTSLGDPATGETGGNMVASHRENATAANNSIYNDFGTITTTGITGESGSGIAWKLSPNANAFASSPLRLNVGKIACPASITTYITYWAQASAASGISGQLRVFGGRYPGVGSAGTDITAAVSGTAWTQYTLSFTPTENCVVDVFMEVSGSSSQSMTVSGPVVITQ
jgi:hypothetical protein